MSGTIFVANEAGATVVALRGNQVVRTFTHVTQPAGLAHVQNTVALVDVRENTLTFYNASTLAPIVELPAGAGPTHVLAEGHDHLIVADTRGGALLVYTPPPDARQIARVALPGRPYGLTDDPGRDRVWGTLTAANQVVGYDMSQPTPRKWPASRPCANPTPSRSTRSPPAGCSSPARPRAPSGSSTHKNPRGQGRAQGPAAIGQH